MRPEVEDLLLERDELAELAGLPDLDDSAFADHAFLIGGVSVALGRRLWWTAVVCTILAVAFFWRFATHDPVPTDVLAVAVGTCVVWGAALAFVRVQLHRRLGLFRTLQRLEQEVQQFDKVVRTLGVMDDLRAAQGVAVDTPDRRDALSALGQARADLVAAVRTERVIRENRELIAGVAALGTSLHAEAVIDLANEATEYATLVRDTVSVAAHVRSAMLALSEKGAPSSH